MPRPVRVPAEPVDPVEIVDPAVADIRGRAGAGRRIAFVSGNFNVLHPGHVRLLKFASEVGDHLVVGVTGDEAAGVSVPAEMRVEGLRSLSVVDHAFVLDGTPEAFIARLKPEAVVKGREFEDRHNPEQAVVDGYGGKLHFSSGEVRFSSTHLIQQEFLETNFSSIRKPRDFPVRHDFAISELKAVLPRLSGIRVLVVGDLIVDSYITCDPLGMSQEDPTIVVTPIEERTFVGGAGIVAAHARGLGADVSFLSVGGVDDKAAFAREALAGFGVEADVLVDETRPTTLKQRFRALGKTLLRVNHLRQHAVDHDLVDALAARIDAHLPSTDLLLFSDFNYGCLPQTLVARVVERARSHGVMMAADSQASSQQADISRFKGMRLVTPTEREARLAIRDFESGLVTVAEHLQGVAGAENVLVTLGSEGLLLHALENGGYVTDRLPAFNTAPKDVAGAGDSLFTCAALALCAGVDIWQSTYLGALAAACQVSRVGNLPLGLADLVAEIDHPHHAHLA